MKFATRSLVLLVFLFFGLAAFGQDSTAVQPKPNLGKGKTVAKDSIAPKAKPNLGKGKGTATTPTTDKKKERKTKEDKTEATEQIAKKKEAKDKRFKQFFDRKNAPLKAVLLSATLPGMGQVYNRRYWKVPIVMGALGGMGYLIHRNTRYYKNYRKAYLYRVDDDEYTVDPYTAILTSGNLKTLRDANRKNMELSYIGFFALYFLTGVDAFVDAHLSTFDVSEDLSMSISPTLIPHPGGNAPVLGFGVSLFGNKKQAQVPKNLF